MPHSFSAAMNQPSPSIPKRRSGRWVLPAIALVCVLPLLAALYFRFVSPPEPAALVGQALEPAAFPFVAVQRLDGQPLAHPEVAERWMVVHAGSGACDSGCRNALYLTRQARTAQGRNMERIQRVWIVTDAAQPAADLLALHPDLLLLNAVDRRAMDTFAAAGVIHLVDRRGFVVFRYAPAVEPKAFILELGKLVKF
ncbi:MAG: hypothetical protein Q8M11_11540 [Sulfuritalea sp.]|nr:hypothetical protein [Sulfuritalea sp.]MDP1985608.1 hypothetical protein [Sulfuritalea sp.]